jgi:hypothetical protein
MNPIRPKRRPIWLALAVAPSIIVTARGATAADPTMSECLAANESAIKLRADHKLRQARDQSLLCSASSCPGELRDACQARVKQISAALPSIVFLAKDAAGHALVAVRVSMDGEPMGDRLDGTAIEVDPGQHRFAFEVAGQPPVEETIIISEGQKDRRETVTLGGAPEPVREPPPAPVPSPTPSVVGSFAPPSTPVASTEPPGGGQRIAGIVVGAVGLVGLGLGAVTGAIAASDWSTAKNDCNGQSRGCTTTEPASGKESSANTMATISTVGFIGGGALAAAGIIVFLTAPRAPSSEARPSARALQFVPAAGPGRAGIAVIGSF